MTDVRSTAELTEASTSGLRWVSVARVIGELTMLGSMIVLARLIPPSAFGMFAIAVLVQELATTIPSEGVGTRSSSARPSAVSTSRRGSPWRC